MNGCNSSGRIVWHFKSYINIYSIGIIKLVQLSLFVLWIRLWIGFTLLSLGSLMLVALIVCLWSLVALASLSLTTIHLVERGSVEDRDREGPTAPVSGIKRTAVSATGLGWFWQLRAPIKGPALIYNGGALRTPFSLRCKQQYHWRTSGMWCTLWFTSHLVGQTIITSNYWAVTPASYFALLIIYQV